MYDLIRAKLAKGEPIILDGGTGTDIQRRGVPMSNNTWCAEANLTHPDIVREVHGDYIRAGAGSDTVHAGLGNDQVYLFFAPEFRQHFFNDLKARLAHHVADIEDVHGSLTWRILWRGFRG